MIQSSNIKNRSEEKVFLALTALEDFREPTPRLILLNHSCLSPLNLKHYELLNPPFGTFQKAEEAFETVNALYENALPKLVESLNLVHRVNYGNRFWRIVIGPWLRYYISSTYDRYSHLKIATIHYPNFRTILLSEDSYVNSQDTLEFVCNLREDAFNLQIYSRILRSLDAKFPCKSFIKKEDLNLKIKPAITVLDNIKNLISRLTSLVAVSTKQSIILKSSYFAKSAELRFFIKSFGKVISIFDQPVESGSPNEKKIRKNLIELNLGESEFEICLSHLINFDIPKSFIENFEMISVDKYKIYPKKVKAIFSANAWYYDEMFKQWAAQSAESGTLLLGSQHGGNYGSLAFSASENHETAILDYFYSWGWSRNNCFAKVLPMPSSKLLRIKKMGASNQKEGILWVLTEYEKYLNSFPDVPLFCLEYSSRQARFASLINTELLKRISIRPHSIDCGWNIAKRLSESYPVLTIDSREKTFLESLEVCRLYVADHLSTTFIESLTANKPTVLFWNPEETKLREDAAPFYEILNHAGILHFSPEEAAVTVNLIYNDVESWWNEPARQAAVAKFCSQFGKTSNCAMSLWTEEFKKISRL